VAFVIAELLYGRRAHSLALVADAGHNLSDVLSLGLAWGASILTRRQPSQRRTYGLRRSSILAAVINAVVLLIAIGAIAAEAIPRFAHPSPVAGTTVIWVAAVGIAINGGTAVLFMAGRTHDLNIRGAFLHMAADAGVSLGVVLAGLAMLATGWWWLDPVVSLIIAGVILISTWGLLRDSVNLALDAVPDEIDAHAVAGYLARLPGVVSVHDLHIWGMSTTETALTCHLVVPTDGDSDALITRAARELHDRFGIEHTTLQVETGTATCACSLAPAPRL
jgi:cobalt-zinc-cadmium efflux system protein